MIKITSSLAVKFDSDQSLDINPTEIINPDAQRRLLKKVDAYLLEKGASCYSVGVVGDDGDTSIIENSGYWVITYSERGETRFIAIFFSFMDAVKFFICNRIGKHQSMDDFSWGDIF